MQKEYRQKTRRAERRKSESNSDILLKIFWESQLGLDRMSKVLFFTDIFSQMYLPPWWIVSLW